jgi:hypothetical protein
MSPDEVARKAKQTYKSVKEMIDKAEGSTQKAIDRAAPVFAKSLDMSLEAASNAFQKTIKAIDGATAGDQARLFRAYKKVLEGQVGFVDAKIRALEDKARTKR